MKDKVHDAYIECSRNYIYIKYICFKGHSLNDIVLFFLELTILVNRINISFLRYTISTEFRIISLDNKQSDDRYQLEGRTYSQNTKIRAKSAFFESSYTK